MEQQQFKVSLSVGTKLLISVVSLLFVSIAFLNISTILILERDKRAYTYQSQSTEAVLLGREFTNNAKHVFDTLRVSLASIDPLKPITPQQYAALQSVIDNQSEIIGVSLEMVDPKSGILRPIARVAKATKAKEAEFRGEDFIIPQELMKVGLPEMRKFGYTFLNPSKVGKPPTLATVLADLKYKGNPSGIPVAIAFSSLRDFAKEIKASNLGIVNREGWVLFNTDPTAFFSKKNIADDPLYNAAISSQLSTGATEYVFEGTRYLGSYIKPGFDLIVLTKTEWRKAMNATYQLTEKFILLGFMAIGAAIIFAILFSKTITAPIKALYEATETVAQGNFDVQISSKSRDEIGSLTNAFVAMSKRINELIKEMVKKADIEHELAIASTVQQTLLPPERFDHEKISIRSHYQSATECGGDWWGFFGVQDKMCVMIADATGHGLPSALITASARSCFSVMHKLAQEDPDFTFSPGAMLSYANRVVHDAASGQIMMTFFVGTIDFDTGKLTYASAGHNPPWLFKKEDGKFTLKSLVGIGQRLGEARDVPPYQEQSIDLTPGDILFLYTDGLTEGKNLAGDMFGKKRARKLVEAGLPKGPEFLIKNLMSDFLKYNEGKSFDDDVTLAAAQIINVKGQTE